jgi:hypothetical protein
VNAFSLLASVWKLHGLTFSDVSSDMIYVSEKSMMAGTIIVVAFYQPTDSVLLSA